MFWDAPWDAQAQSDICYESVGASPYPENHITKEWGVEADWAERASNIVWSQGEYDPWKGGGVQTNLSSTLLSVVIPESAVSSTLTHPAPCQPPAHSLSLSLALPPSLPPSPPISICSASRPLSCTRDTPSPPSSSTTRPCACSPATLAAGWD